MEKLYFNEEEDKKLFSDLSDVLSDGEIFTRRNPAIDGEIRIKRGGMNEGLVHLIDHRIRERVLNKKESMDLEKDKKGRYVVTGYDNKQTKKEATESINAVIAQYGQSPEFLGIYAQVGAVIASYGIRPHSSEKSSEKSQKSAPSLEDMVYKGAAVTIGEKKIKCEYGLLEEFRKNYHLLEAEREKNRQLSEQVAALQRQVGIPNRPVRYEDFEIDY